MTLNELENEEEANEVERKTRTELLRFGRVQSVELIRQEDDRNEFELGDVVVTFHREKEAASAFRAYHEVLCRGTRVTCSWVTQREEQQEKMTVTIHGMLTSEELQDPDEFADVKDEMMQIFDTHGHVRVMHIDETTGDIRVTFLDERVANKVVQLMNGSRYGGRLLTASFMLQNGEGAENVEHVNAAPVVKAKRVAGPIVQVRPRFFAYED